MEEAFRALLRASNDVTAFSGDRINWGAHPQSHPWPAIVLTVISDGEGHTLGGPDGLSRARVQVDCYALTYAAAKTMSRAVRTALDGFRGGIFQGVFLAGVRDGTDTSGSDRLFRSSLDFFAHYNRT